MEYEFDTKNKSLLETETYKKTSNSMNGVVKSSPTYTEIMRSFAIGDLNVKLQKRFMLKKIDELWINAIEDCLPSLDTIIRNPQFRLQEKEEVLPVEISKHINGRSVIHLSQHTDLINEIKDDGSVVPSKLLNVFQEDTFLTYENKFINTLVNRLYAFIAIRYNGAKECGEDEKNTSITMDQKFEHNEYKGKISLSIEIAQAPKEHEIIKNYIYTSDLWKRVQKLYNVVSEYASSSFIQSMGKNFVHLPIMRTNTLLKNPLFKDCLALWEFIESYENTGYETLVQEDLLDVPNKLLEDMYNAIAEQYVVFQSHLNNEIEEQKALDSRIVNISPKIQDELEELDEDEFDYKTLIPDILADELPLEHPDDDIEYAILVALAADSMMYQEENDEEDVAVIDKSGDIQYRYKYSFYARLIKAQLPTQDYYNEIKNELMSYEDIKCFASWNRELFKQGRKPCAKLNCKGKTLFVYLPLDPKEFDANKYHHLDVSKEDGKNEYPFLLKVRSNRACKYAKELIALVMERYEIAKREVYEPKDYHMAPMSLDEMLEKDLARLIGENGSFHSVETVEDQEVPEMEAKPAEPEPVEEPVVEEVKPEEPVVAEEGDEGFGWKYKFSFAARLILSGDERQDFYNAVKNNILSYKKVNSKVSWGHELFKLGRIKIAELKVRGKTLCVYLPLDPDKYDQDRLHFQDMRVEGKEVEFPMMMKVKSDRAVKYVAELIADVMANNNIVKNDAYEEKNYKFAYMTIDEMLVSDPVLAKLIEGEVPNIPSKPVETQPEPVVEPAPAPVEAEEDEEGINFKYKFSFSARLIRAGDDRQDFYNAIKNHALSYKKVNSKISWGHETIKLGRIKIALLKVKGKTLCVYLPLDPDKYDQDRLHFQDLRAEGKEVEFPMMLKVKSDRGVKYACELIDEVMMNNEIPHNDNYEEQDYRLPHMSIEEMLNAEPPLAKLTDNAELPVVEKAPVEVKEEAPVVEEVKPEPVKEPEPIVVEAPVKAEAESEDGLGFNSQYKFSFSARLIFAGDETQDFYNTLKNEFLSYKKVASKISWGHELFKLGRIKLAEFKVRGKGIYVYLPLNPDNYEESRFHHKDLRVEGKEVEFPMLMKVKSARAVNYVIELIKDVMSQYEIVKNDAYVASNYKLESMTIEEMLNAVPSLAKLSEGSFIPSSERKAEEVVVEEIPAPVVEEPTPEPVVEPEPVKESEPMVEPEPVVEEKPAEPEPVKEPEPAIEPEPVKEEPKQAEKKSVSPFSLFRRHKNEEKEVPAPAPQPVVEEPKAEEVKVQEQPKVDEQPKVEKQNKGVYSKFLSGILGKNKK